MQQLVGGAMTPEQVMALYDMQEWFCILELLNLALRDYGLVSHGFMPQGPKNPSIVQTTLWMDYQEDIDRVLSRSGPLFDLVLPHYAGRTIAVGAMEPAPAGLGLVALNVDLDRLIVRGEMKPEYQAHSLREALEVAAQRVHEIIVEWEASCRT